VGRSAAFANAALAVIANAANNVSRWSLLRCITSAISGGAQSARRLLVEILPRRALSLQAARRLRDDRCIA